MSDKVLKVLETLGKFLGDTKQNVQHLSSKEVDKGISGVGLLTLQAFISNSISRWKSPCGVSFFVTSKKVIAT